MKTWWKGPVKAEPDFENLLRVLRRQKPARPTLFEFFLNNPLYARLAGAPPVREDMDAMEYRRLQIKAFRNAGYDYATIHVWTFGFPAKARHSDKTCSLNEGFVITDRASFESYAWQDPDKCDYSVLEKLRPDIPRGMKLVVPGPGGVLENLISLVGYDNMCFMLADDPDLLRDITDAIGSRLVRHYEKVAVFDTVGAIIGNDDWGFKTQPMLSPEAMRQYIIPWHRKIVAAAHKAGKPAILHSCGNLETLMEDIITDIKYDGKHSYEDAILPVEKAYDRYGSRIAILGGIDVDYVIRAGPEAVYKRSAAMLERASKRGGFALGTGNSVPAYVPDDNYFAMTAAAIQTRY